jgi:cellulose synthase operon protein C
MTPGPLQRLGEYDVLAPISEGGMASVWLGRSVERPERLVALKVIRPEHVRNKDFIAMFRDEARIASKLSHPNIIQIHGLGHDGRQHFLAMEVLRGRTLLDVWEAAHARGRRLPFEAVAWIGARIADALHYAHELVDDEGTLQNVVHRDVNPANIFLTQEGVPKLIDFGLAKARDRIASTAVGVVKGKLAYLAPEQATGRPADRRADVFALGVTLWEVSLDRRLFRDDSDTETVRRVLDGDVPEPASVVPDYPSGLSRAILRALARDPDDRWQTAAELRDALDAFVREGERGIDEGVIASLVAELSGGDRPADWERLVDDAAVGPERLQVWDDDRQKMTWMHAAMETAIPRNADEQAAPARAPASNRREQLDRALEERLSRMDPTADALGVARAHLERAIVDEMLGDASEASRHAEESLRAAPTGSAHEILRRLGHARGAAGSLVSHLDAEIEECAVDGVRADLLAERARLLSASGEPVSVVREAWERVLAISPAHAAALTGLEGALSSDPAALARHLARMASAYAAEPRLAAWLHVERARLLDRDLGRTDAARAALDEGLALDGGIGPVRAACMRHALAHDDAAWRLALLVEEAGLECDPARAARLEVDAACVARHRLGDASRAVALLERAVGRAAVSESVERRALDELVALHESAGHPRDALRIRRLRASRLADPRSRACELRKIAALEESTGDRRAAIVALEEALERCPDDATLGDELDRLLEAESLTDRRIDHWARQSALTGEPRERARRLLRAARLAESSGDLPRAASLLRSALVAHPADDEALDGLLRILTPTPTEATKDEALARIAVHAHAAEHSFDDGRRVAHLETMARLEEEALGDPARASRTYQAVLRIEPGRRVAVLGLARTAARAGDATTLADALVDEASMITDGSAAEALRVRAAEALAPIDAERALAIVHDVLSRSPAHAEARRLEQRLHESAGRWAQVDAVLAARIEHATDDRTRVDVLMARAALQSTRLGATPEALASLRAALTIDPQHPAARDALLEQLDVPGDARALRDAFVTLASSESTLPGRVRALVRAAEIDELVLRDDVHADQLYAEALAGMPDEVWIEERRVGALARRALEGHAGDLVAALAAQCERQPDSHAAAFDLASTLLDEGCEVGRVASLLAPVLASEPKAPHGPRTLQRLARMTNDDSLVASALARQAEAFAADTPKLGAWWSVVSLAEWVLPDRDAATVVERILGVAPADRAAQDAGLRAALPRMRAGDTSSRAAVVSTLAARVVCASTDTQRLALHLSLALALEPGAALTPDSGAQTALSHYREALRIEPRSVVAAAGAARLGVMLGDVEATVAAALAHADLAARSSERAVFLVEAASQLLSTQAERLGARGERLARAGEVLERALDADPEALPAVVLLVAVRGEDGMRDQLLSALRAALGRARSTDAVVRLGAEVARVACIDPPDRVLAVDALRRVLSSNPEHPATLRALADLYVAQEAWGEAVETLETLGAQARDPRSRLAALFQLADLYGGSLRRPLEVERVLSLALDIDPTHLDALRRLVAFRRASAAEPETLAPLLARVADVETEPKARAVALTELAELRETAGDRAGAETALVEATAHDATAARLARVLGLHADVPAEQARTLADVVARAQDLGRPDASCVAALGKLEIALGRWADSVDHLRLAVALAPTVTDVRAGLAKALLHHGAPAEATKILVPMITPDPPPLLSLKDPADALATLEHALEAEGRRDEALVARELRAVAGGLDDGAHAELRARRLAIDPAAPIPIALDPTTLRGTLVPNGAPAQLFDLASAIAGAEAKLVQATLEDFGVTSRDRLLPASGHPLLMLVHRLATMLGIARPEVALCVGAGPPRVAAKDGLWLVVPEAILELPEPTLTASLARLLVRIALALPWLEDASSRHTHALLCAAARQVNSTYAAASIDPEQQELVADLAKQVGRAIGRRQKKALVELALAESPAPTLADVAAFERAVARTELRAAFVMTGDLLATLDAVRATDASLLRATASVGPSALAATLAHPLAGDLATFALSSAAMGLRWRAGTLWSGSSGGVR